MLPFKIIPEKSEKNLAILENLENHKCGLAFYSCLWYSKFRIWDYSSAG